MTANALGLSRIRTLLFGALALVWFIEMLLWGVPSLSKSWTDVWNYAAAETRQLVAALTVANAVRAAAKGALFVMAVFGLRSKDPSTRTALFMSMALVPPLNIAFPFREQGFPTGSVAVATAFSTILWGSFFLFRERTQEQEQKRPRGLVQVPLSRWEVFQYVWFAINSAGLTLMAILFLFWPRMTLDFVFPHLTALLGRHEGDLSSLILSNLASGTHILALAIASWIATVNCRNNPALRRALTVASTVHAGLFFVFPLRQMLVEFGAIPVSSSLLIGLVPIFAGWVLYAIADTRRARLSARQLQSNLSTYSLENNP